MPEYNPEEIVEFVREIFAKEDPRLWPYHLTGAWFGYYGGLAERQVTNLTGGPSDPYFVHQMVEHGRAGMGMLAVKGTRKDVSPYEFPDPLDVFRCDEKGGLELKLQDLMNAYKAGKDLGVKLKKHNPPDGSTQKSDLGTELIDLGDPGQRQRYLN